MYLNAQICANFNSVYNRNCGKFIKKEKEVKTNIAIELNDADRNRLHNVCFNTNGKKMISRKELTHMVDLFVEQLLVGEAPREVTKNIANKGMTYYFNNVEVASDVYEGGFGLWLEKRKQGRV